DGIAAAGTGDVDTDGEAGPDRDGAAVGDGVGIAKQGDAGGIIAADNMTAISDGGVIALHENRRCIVPDVDRPGVADARIVTRRGDPGSTIAAGDGCARGVADRIEVVDRKDAGRGSSRGA